MEFSKDLNDKMKQMYREHDVRHGSLHQPMGESPNGEAKQARSNRVLHLRRQRMG